MQSRRDMHVPFLLFLITSGTKIAPLVKRSTAWRRSGRFPVAAHVAQARKAPRSEQLHGTGSQAAGLFSLVGSGSGGANRIHDVAPSGVESECADQQDHAAHDSESRDQA